VAGFCSAVDTYGAGGGAASCIHDAVELGSLSMASFAFEPAPPPAI